MNGGYASVAVYMGEYENECAELLESYTEHTEQWQQKQND